MFCIENKAERGYLMNGPISNNSSVVPVEQHDSPPLSSSSALLGRQITKVEPASPRSITVANFDSASTARFIDRKIEDGANKSSEFASGPTSSGLTNKQTNNTTNNINSNGHNESLRRDAQPNKLLGDSEIHHSKADPNSRSSRYELSGKQINNAITNIASKTTDEILGRESRPYNLIGKGEISDSVLTRSTPYLFSGSQLHEQGKTNINVEADIGVSSTDIQDTLKASHSIMKKAKSVFHNSIKNAATTFKNTIDQAKNTFQRNDGNFHVTAFNDAIKKAKAVFHSAVDRALTVFQSAIDKMAVVLGDIKGVVDSAGRASINAAEKILGSFIGATNSALSVINSAVDKATTAVDRTATVANDIVSTINDTVGTAINKLVESGNNLMSQLDALHKKLDDALYEALESPRMDRAADRWHKFSDMFKNESKNDSESGPIPNDSRSSSNEPGSTANDSGFFSSESGPTPNDFESFSSESDPTPNDSESFSDESGPTPNDSESSSGESGPTPNDSVSSSGESGSTTEDSESFSSSFDSSKRTEEDRSVNNRGRTFNEELLRVESALRTVENMVGGNSPDFVRAESLVKEVLGISSGYAVDESFNNEPTLVEGLTADELKTARSKYRKFMKNNHPDRVENMLKRNDVTGEELADGIKKATEITKVAQVLGEVLADTAEK